MARPFLARWAGRCKSCGGGIEVGDELVYDIFDEVVHYPDCVTEVPATLPYLPSVEQGWCATTSCHRRGWKQSEPELAQYGRRAPLRCDVCCNAINDTRHLFA